jgi:hypothetical protein
LFSSTSDHQLNGFRINRAGMGPKPLPIQGLSREALQTSLAELLQPAYMERTRQIAPTVRERRGEERAVTLLEELVQRRTVSPSPRVALPASGAQSAAP